MRTPIRSARLVNPGACSEKLLLAVRPGCILVPRMPINLCARLHLCFNAASTDLATCRQSLLQAMREEQLDSLKKIADGVQQVRSAPPSVRFSQPHACLRRSRGFAVPAIDVAVLVILLSWSLSVSVSLPMSLSFFTLLSSSLCHVIVVVVDLIFNRTWFHPDPAKSF